MAHRCPYFVRFARTPAGTSLSATQSRRILAAGAGTPAPAPDTVASATQFLATLSLLQGFDELEEDEERALLTVLGAWQHRFRGKFVGETAERCLMLLEGSS